MVHELHPLSISDWLHFARFSFNGSLGSFSSELPDTRHHGRYTRAGTRACSETLPFVAPCPREPNPVTFGLTWIRADRLVGDKITDGLTGRLVD